MKRCKISSRRGGSARQVHHKEVYERFRMVSDNFMFGGSVKLLLLDSVT